MNRRVLESLIFLLWLFLITFAVLKFFFGDIFAAVISNEKIIALGNFIDNNQLLKYLGDFLISLFVWHLYLCACMRLWRLTLKHYIFVVICVLLTNLGYIFFPDLMAPLDVAALLIFPLAIGATSSRVVKIFITHYVGQAFILYIRSEPLYLISTNYATQLILILDAYIWLILYYLYSNLYKEEKSWANQGFRFSEIIQKMRSWMR